MNYNKLYTEFKVVAYAFCDEVDDVGDGDFCIIFVGAMFEFDHAFVEISLTDCNAIWDAQEVVVFEFDTSAGVAVVVENFDASGFELCNDFFGSRCYIFVFHQHGSDDDVERRDGGGEINTIFVVILFDGGG